MSRLKPWHSVLHDLVAVAAGRKPADTVITNASDAKWSQFKLLVTNADGTQTVETLAQAGITAINLKTDTTNIQYRDGSAITGETSFTFSNGTTGTVASVSLATDGNGHKLVQTTAVNGATTTITSTYRRHYRHRWWCVVDRKQYVNDNFGGQECAA